MRRSARAATHAATYDAHAALAARAVTYAAAGAAAIGAYWERRDVPGMLARLIECGR